MVHQIRELLLVSYLKSFLVPKIIGKHFVEMIREILRRIWKSSNCQWSYLDLVSTLLSWHRLVWKPLGCPGRSWKMKVKSFNFFARLYCSEKITGGLSYGEQTYLIIVTSCTDPATKTFANVSDFDCFFLFPTKNHNTKTILGKNIKPMMLYPQTGWPLLIWSADTAPSPVNAKKIFHLPWTKYLSDVKLIN